MGVYRLEVTVHNFERVQVPSFGQVVMVFKMLKGVCSQLGAKIGDSLIQGNDLFGAEIHALECQRNLRSIKFGIAVAKTTWQIPFWVTSFRKVGRESVGVRREGLRGGIAELESVRG